MAEPFYPLTKNKHLRNRLFYILLLLYHAVIFKLAHNLPFLGDSLPNNLFAAENIYNHQLGTIWNIPQADPGHPTLYPYLTALVWMVFGKSLWATHLLTAFTGFFLSVIVFKIASRYLDDSTAKFAVLLIVISPLYVAQLFSASLHLPLTALAFAALYYWQQKKRGAYSLALCLMMLCHLQGAFLLLFLAINDIADTWLQKGRGKLWDWFAKNWWVYTLPFTVFAAWLLLHRQQFGWALASPNYIRDMPGFKGFLYNLAIACWRIIDFGYIIPFAVVVYFFASRRKVLHITDNKTKLLVTYLLCLVVLVGGICLTFALSPAHRYFFAASVLLIILFAGAIGQMSVVWGRVWATTACIFFLAGNFMYYPGKCMGDDNLAYLPIHELEKNLVYDFPKGTVFYTYAPLSNPSSIRYLDSSKGAVFKGLYHANMDSIDYVVQSNLNCEFTPAQLEKLKSWHGTSYEEGSVYLNVYANPARVPKPEGWQLRQPSKAEKWLKDLKNKISQ